MNPFQIQVSRFNCQYQRGLSVSLRLLLAVWLVIATFIGSTPAAVRAAFNWRLAAPLIVDRSGHATIVLPDGQLLVSGGYSQNPIACAPSASCFLASSEIYAASTNTWTVAASMHTGRSFHTATLLPNSTVLVTGGFTNSAEGYTANTEVYDPDINLWTTVAPLPISRADHTATLLLNGRVLVTGGSANMVGVLTDTATYDPDTQTWLPTAPLNAARYGHTATLLPDGRVLVAGGRTFSGNWLASAEIYDPAANTWTMVASLNAVRYVHTATLLPNGKVLVAGGFDNTHRSPNGYVTSAEVYDPLTDVWSPTAPLKMPRAYHTANLLPNGQVLIAGGWGASGDIAETETFDFNTNTWALGPTLNAVRYNHTTTVLPGGQVVVTGGWNGSGTLHSVELYDDQNAGSWTPTYFQVSTFQPLRPATTTARSGRPPTLVSLTGNRQQHTATLLPTNQVLITGGVTTGTLYLTSTLLFDPIAAAWTAAAPLHTARAGHTATRLTSGEVLVVGGFNSSGYLSSVEKYDPATNSWLSVVPLNTARQRHSATLLPGGQVLVVGGVTTGTLVLDNAEIYDPCANTWTTVAPLTAARMLHTATLLPIGLILVTGGEVSGGYLNSAEIYDPNANLWTTVAPLNLARSTHTATPLPDGRVLIVGGRDSSGVVTDTETYDPGLDAWLPVSPLNLARDSHTATLLPNGKVLVTGGMGDGSVLTSTEVYDPGVDTWTTLAALSAARSQHTATLLPSGKVLVAGGDETLISAEVYDRDLGFADGWRPTVITATSPLTLGQPLSFTGLGYGGYPLVQIQRLDNAQWSWVTPSAFSNITYTARPLTSTLGGPALLTVLVNGIPSNSYPLTITYPTTTTISAPPITYNANGLVTVTVSAESAMPAGVMTLSVDGKAPLTQAVMPRYGSVPRQARAVFTLSSLDAGTHTLQADYAMQAAFADSRAAGLLIVNRVATTTTLASSPNPSTFGQALLVTATVLSGAGTPTGTVTFRHGATVLGSSSLNGEVATATLTLPKASMYALTADYGGTTNYFASESAVMTQTVNRAATLTALASSASPTVYGQSITLTATVTSSGGLPTGTVTFKSGAMVVGARTLAGGIATFNPTALAAGTYTFTAEYEGSDNYNLSSSGELTQTVNRAATATALVASHNPVILGRMIIFTATVQSGVGTPTGVVTFKIGNSALGTGTLSSGIGTFSTGMLVAGTHTVTAEYDGDDNYNLSASATLMLKVNRPVFLPLLRK